MLERTERVRKIWIKDYERERRGKLVSVIPHIMAYSMGFWTGTLGHGIYFWASTVVISLLIWKGLRYLRDVYKINI